VGPIPIGVNKFIFEADPPNLSRLPATEILGVTVILLTCSYDGREFVRVGYYVNNEYDNEEMNNDPPPKPVIERIRRNILAEKPRVTRFAIKWYVLIFTFISTCPTTFLQFHHRDSEESAPAEFPPDQPEADTLDDDGTGYGAEEAEMQAALEQELQETEATLAQKADKTKTEGDKEMAEADGEDTKKGDDEDEDSDAGSEDLEEESSESEDDEDEEEGAEGEDTEMGDADDKGAATADTNGEQKAPTTSQSEVMVH